MTDTTDLGRKGLGRLPAADERDANFRLAAPPTLDLPTYKYYSTGPVLDQGAYPYCVGYAWRQWLSSAVLKTKTGPAAPTIYSEAQKVDEWPGECVDTETEILSSRGWLKYNELVVGDEILGFDLETETTRWAIVEKVHQFESAPYRIWSQRGFSVGVTDNHRWPVRLRPNGSDGFPRPFRMTTTQDWKPGDEFIRSAPCSEQPSTIKYDDDFVELIAWVMCEGYYRPPSRRGNGICVSQKVHRERVIDLMNRFGVAPGYMKSDGTHVWEMSGSLAKSVREIAPNKAPEISFLRALTHRQLCLFLEVCELADGCRTPAKGNRQSRGSFAQKTGPILDSWLVACALAGQPVSRASKETGSLKNVESWTLRRNNTVETRKLSPSLYITGPVWCPQTELGTFVARRDGAVFITGNSYAGTSVRGGAKVLQTMGHIESYVWAWDAPTVKNFILSGSGTVVVGTNWYEDMFGPDANGYIHPTGPSVGGHAYLLIGFSQDRNAFRMINSWGRSWGEYGRAWISYDDMALLIGQDGECCTAYEKRIV